MLVIFYENSTQVKVIDKHNLENKMKQASKRVIAVVVLSACLVNATDEYRMNRLANSQK